MSLRVTSVNCQVIPNPLADTTQALRGENDEQAEEKFKVLSQKIADLSTVLSAKDEYVKQQAQIAKEAMEEMVSMRQKLTQLALSAEEAAAGREKAAADCSTLKQQLEVAYQQKNTAEARVLHLDGALKECMKEVRNVREDQEQKIRETALAKKREWDKVRAELELEMAHLRRQVLESGAENRAMTKSLQERAKSLVELNEAKAKAETEVKILQVQIERMEKEMDAYKYEVHVLKKELQIRNDENEYSKKVADAAHKQQLENVKKIAKLDSECQRLRSLVRKKLPGPGALAQMRLEVGYVSKMESPKKRSNSRSLQYATEHEDLQVNTTKELDALTDRVFAMEDETKLLKEVLVKRTGELQAARQLCARTATKLSTAENLLEAIASGQTQTKASSDSQVAASIAGVETMDVMDWAASSEEGGNDDEVSCAESWASALIAELSHLKNDEASPKNQKNSSKPNSKFDNIAEGVTQQVSQLQTTLNATLHKIIDKLSSVLENLQSFEYNLKQIENSPSLFELVQPGFSRLSEDISRLKQALQEVRKATENAKLARANLESLDIVHIKASDCPAEEGDEPSLKEQVVHQISSTQLTTLQKVLCNVVESLILLGVQEDRCVEAGGLIVGQKPLKIQAQGLVVLQNDKLVLDCEDQDAAAVLFQVVNVLRCQYGLDPVGDDNTVLSLYKQTAIVSLSKSTSTEGLEIAISQEPMSGEVGDRIDQADEELVTSSEMARELEGMRSELVKAMEQKNELEQNLRSAEEELERMRGRLSELEEGLARTEKELTEKQGLETELTSTRTELQHMQAQVTELTAKSEGQARRCEELQGLLSKRDGSRETTVGRRSTDRDVDVKSRKEREVAAAKQQLAECQRTILVLGNQLRSLHDPVEGSSFDSSLESATSLDQKNFPLSTRVDLLESVAGSSSNFDDAAPPPLVDGYHHHSHNLLVPRRYRRPPSAGFVRTRNGRLISADQFWNSNVSFLPASVDTDVYSANQVHCHTAPNPASSYSFSSRHAPELYAGGMCLQSPLHEYVTEASGYNYSPPETAMSSPARSPARFDVQLEHAARLRSTGSSNAGARSSPMKSMNTAGLLAAGDAKPSKPGSTSRLFRLFGRSKT